MMRAVVLRALTGADGVEVGEMPAPGGGPGSGDNVIIEVHAAGVGFPDLLMTKGQYQIKPQPPFVPGVEAAGVVLSAPESSGYKAGDRVTASSNLGAWAEIASARPLSTLPVPDGMSFAEATAMVNYQTAYFAYAWRGGVKAGETVLIHGAAGGTGTAAVQVAKGMGCNVIAIAQGQQKLDVARACGADHCIDADGEWLAQVKEIAPKGIDVVYDPVGGDRFTDSVRVAGAAGAGAGDRLRGGGDPGGEGEPAAAAQHVGDRGGVGRVRARGPDDAAARSPRAWRRCTRRGTSGRRSGVRTRWSARGMRCGSWRGVGQRGRLCWRSVS